MHLSGASGCSVSGAWQLVNQVIRLARSNQTARHRAALHPCHCPQVHQQRHLHVAVVQRGFARLKMHHHLPCQGGGRVLIFLLFLQYWQGGRLPLLSIGNSSQICLQGSVVYICISCLLFCQLVTLPSSGHTCVGLGCGR